MAHARHALTLAAAIVAVIAARAPAQPVPAPSPRLPDPAAALLTPVASDPLPVITPRGVAPHEQRESAARMTIGGDGFTTVRAADYDDSRRTATAYASPAAGTGDPLDYLTDGRYRSDAGGRPTRSNFDRGTKNVGKKYDDEDGFGSKLGRGVDDLLRGRDDCPDAKRYPFQSEREFDGFISPVSNPFLFEDPRSLTELRAIALFQNIPNREGTFRGGNTMFFGGQARLAFTDRLSVVVNKVGLSTFNPGSGSTLPDRTGLSELWLGPKFVLIRDPENQTLLTAGATFQIPLGSEGVFQDTGSLSIVPYLSAAQRLIQTQWGTFNGMANAGYSISVNNKRSDYFYANGHLSFDVGNQHMFYPLVEASWFSYTTNGQSRNLGVEGFDLANIGAASSGTNLVRLALGGRYKSPNGRWEIGGAYELPLFGNRELFDSRFTVDLIWRY